MEKDLPNSIKIVLASKSRDRKLLFDRVSIPVEIIPSNFDENTIIELDPYKLVEKIAIAKAKTVLEIRNGKKVIEKGFVIIIAADTMVLIDGQIVGKAQNIDHAFQILTLLSGNTHELITGVAIIKTQTNEIKSFVDKSLVHFQTLTSAEIWDYLHSSDEYIGRAGAYSLYDRASLFIDFIEGSPTNVLGLPMARIRKELQKIGINLLDLKELAS